MARIFLRRTLTGFMAADADAAEAVKNFKVGQIFRADVVRPRSYTHHKLAMALLQLTFENQDVYDDFEIFRKAVAREAGHVVRYPDLNGEMVTEAGSLSYDAIPDDIEFGKVMASMMTVCAHLLHDIGLDELEAEVARYADAHYGRAA